MDPFFSRPSQWLGRSSRVLLFALALCISASTVAAGKPADQPGQTTPSVVLDGRDVYDLHAHVAVLAETGAALTLEQVSSPELASQFGPAPFGPVPHFGVIDHPVWARVILENPGAEAAPMLLAFEYPVVDSVELHLSGQGGAPRVLRAGDAVAHSPELPSHRYFVFPIEVPAAASLPLYLRIETSSSTSIPLRLWKPQAFSGWNQSSQLLFGLLFGATALFVVYTTAVASVLRKPASGWFSLYISLFALLVAVRQGFLQSWLGEAVLPYNELINLSVIGALYFSAYKLLREFLNVRRYAHRSDRVLQVLQWLSLAFVPLALVGSPLDPLVGAMIAMFGPVFTSFLTLRFWYKRVPNAAYFACGWLAGNLTSLLDALRIAGVVGHWPRMDELLPISLGVCAVIFALAVIQQTQSYQLDSRQDPLTGLANRRHFHEHLEHEIMRARRSGDPLALIMLDVDWFKQFNDLYGHERGDRCLESIAAVLSSTARRQVDVAARYGGEEFVVLLSGTHAAEARPLAEGIRASIEGLGIAHEGSGVSNVVTASLGVSVAVPEANADALSLLRPADQALYHAKRTGRNRVAHAGLPAPDLELKPEDVVA